MQPNNFSLELIRPDWPAPSTVKAYTTTRQGGVSHKPYDSFNLADHVQDDSGAVKTNRQRLKMALNLPTEPAWLTQVHSSNSVCLGSKDQFNCVADASYTNIPKMVCVVLTADCLPILLCDREGIQVAALHAGWRGLAGGVLEQTMRRFKGPRSQLLAWLGPAIGPEAFEVGDEVRSAFIEFLPSAELAFQATRAHHWKANLYLLAQQRLAASGIHAVYGGQFCTYSESERFFSYRRDKMTGRLASLIWFE